jgi:hypothetical protein
MPRATLEDLPMLALVSRRSLALGLRSPSLSLALLAGVAATALGCAGSVPLSRYRAVTGNDWPELRPGRMVLLSTASTCRGVTTGATIDEAIDGRGRPIQEVAWLREGAVLTIDETRVQAEKGRLGLGGRVNGQPLFVGIPTGKATCLYSPEVAGWPEARALAGKSLVFAPWRSTCSEIQATGQSPNAALFDSEPGGSTPVGGVELRRPLDSADGTPPVPWVVFAGDTLAVPFPVARDCFAEAGTPEANPPEDLRGSLRLGDEQCLEGTYKGKVHLACKTSLGTWLVHAQADRMTARLSRVTHGPVHFLEGRLVTKEAFATTVVGLGLGTASEPRERALYAAMSRAVADTLAKEQSAVRVTTANDPALTVEVSLALSHVTIGELARTQHSESTTYPDHQEDRPNPKVPEATSRVSAARSAVDTAESELSSAENDLQRSRKLHAAAVSVCRNEAAKAKGKWAGVASASCEVGGALTQPQGRVAEARSSLSQARGELASAQADLESMPRTIREWVMMPWSYQRVHFERPVSVDVNLRVTPKGAPTQDNTTSLRITIADDEVGDDPKHKVKGHSPDPALINRPDELAPRIAAQVSTHVAGRLKAILATEARAATLRALASSGGEPTDPDYQLLDATAFEMVGARIKHAERRGRVRLAGEKVPVPSSGVSLGTDECVLVAAVAEQPATSVVTLQDVTGTVFDRRGANYAVVEVCGRDAVSGTLPAFLLDGTKGTELRWGIYRTK